MTNLGVGAMLNMLTGNRETVESAKKALGKRLWSIEIDDKELKLSFEDDSCLRLWDNGQSCCENRYMRTDDDLSDYVGGELMDLELANGDSINSSEEHDVQFLLVKTSKGTLTVSNHNEHNGYYGGFSIVANYSSNQ